ncbi:MAG TPA: hypothetical protein VJV22_11940 [Acidobacteriaceae bacterium]|nr:hypothetical protein [Acidobacteriaceae bacterium]
MQQLSQVTIALWVLSLACEIAMLLTLLARGQFRTFPIFTAYFAFNIPRGIAEFTTYLLNDIPLYRDLYYSFLLIDYLFQLAIIFEIARIVLRPTGTWVRDARVMFLGLGVTGAVVAAAISWWISPPGSKAWVVWPLRVNLFTSLLTCELFVTMSFTARYLGLGWRNHVMALAQGWTFDNVVMVITTGLQSYFGRAHYMFFDNFRGAAFLVAMTYIIVQFWIPEPERHTIDPELRRYIVALHQRVEYDLRRIDA